MICGTKHCTIICCCKNSSLGVFFLCEQLGLHGKQASEVHSMNGDLGIDILRMGERLVRGPVFGQSVCRTRMHTLMPARRPVCSSWAQRSHWKKSINAIIIKIVSVPAGCDWKYTRANLQQIQLWPNSAPGMFTLRHRRAKARGDSQGDSSCLQVSRDFQWYFPRETTPFCTRKRLLLSVKKTLNACEKTVSKEKFWQPQSCSNSFQIQWEYCWVFQHGFV